MRKEDAAGESKKDSTFGAASSGRPAIGFQWNFLYALVAASLFSGPPESQAEDFLGWIFARSSRDRMGKNTCAKTRYAGFAQWAGLPVAMD